MNKPTPTGAYAVGTFTYSLYEGRKIACRVYYPVDKGATDGYNKPRYMSPEVCKGLSKTLNFPINYNKIEKSGDNYSACFENAPAAEGKFPLVVFSHGAGAYRESNSLMCIDLASHGYVVLCIAHPGMAACVEYDDGTFEYAIKNLNKKSFDPYFKGAMAIKKFKKEKGTDAELAARFDVIQKTYCAFLRENLILWMDDTKRAVAYIKDNHADMIDLSNGIGVTGHSFGGITAYALCQNESEFTCGINIDALTVGDYDGKVLNTPFLQISCKANVNYETRVYLDHTKPVYKVVFNDMEHLGFSDMKYALPVKMLVGALAPDVMHENLCRCHLEFFDAYLKKVKDEPALVSNDAVTVTRCEPDR